MSQLKKIILSILAILAVTGLVACSSTTKTDGDSSSNKTSKEEVTSFQLFDEVGFDSRLTYYHENDTVSKQTTENIVTYSYLEASTKEEAKEIYEANKPNYDYEGVTSSVEFLEDRLVEKLSIDYKKADFKEIGEPLLGMSKNEAQTVKYISFSKSTPLLEKSGYKEVKDLDFQELP